MTRELASTGISLLAAETDGSAPKRTKARDVVVFVTTMVSPPPASAAVLDEVVALSDTVPVGRNGVMEPMAM
jgi:hypothetical protein